jgi:transposase
VIRDLRDLTRTRATLSQEQSGISSRIQKLRESANIKLASTVTHTMGKMLERFGRSRDVGCYLGLRPRRSQSGDHDPHLGITHGGNAYLRSLLIECSNHILRPHGRESALRQWALHLATRGGKQAKSKAVVAVARKLAVLLTASGARKSNIYRSINKRPKKWSCTPVATTSCSDDCVRVLVF